MTNLHILGNQNPRKRKLTYDPNLAEQVNKETEAERIRKELEAKLKKKKQPKQESQEPSPIIIPQAPNFTEASFLGGDFGKTINERIQAKYGTYEAISQVQYDDNDKIVKGTTPFYITAVNEILQEQFPDKNLRTATQADLERILKGNTLPLINHYEDSALILRTKQNPNSYLAEDLFNQFKSRGIKLKENSAYVLPLFTLKLTLKLRTDDKSQYKLAFDITDSTLENYFEAPILNEVSQQKFDSSDIEENTGLPKIVGNAGERRLYTRNHQPYNPENSGLVRLYLNRNLNIGSNDENLAYSVANGRVVVVRAAGTAQNFSRGPN